LKPHTLLEAVEPQDRSQPPVQPADALACKRISRRASGFTIIELLIVVAVILTISAIAVPHFLDALERARIARAVGDLRTIGNAVSGYQVINQQWPLTLDDVGYGSHLDPWGNPYQYLNFTDAKGKGKMRKDRFLVPINSYFDLYSMGKDGTSVPPLTAKPSKDDVVWANDGGFIGLGSDY
jgi:general secretion pathway protein G